MGGAGGVGGVCVCVPVQIQGMLFTPVLLSDSPTSWGLPDAGQ